MTGMNFGAAGSGFIAATAISLTTLLAGTQGASGAEYSAPVFLGAAASAADLLSFGAPGLHAPVRQIVYFGPPPAVPAPPPARRARPVVWVPPAPRVPAVRVRHPVPVYRPAPRPVFGAGTMAPVSWGAYPGADAADRTTLGTRDMVLVRNLSASFGSYPAGLVARTQVVPTLGSILDSNPHGDMGFGASLNGYSATAARSGAPQIAAYRVQFRPMVSTLGTILPGTMDTSDLAFGASPGSNGTNFANWGTPQIVGYRARLRPMAYTLGPAVAGRAYFGVPGLTAAAGRY